MNSQKGVIPAKAGIQLFDNILKILDSCLRRNDLAGHFPTFCETINFDEPVKGHQLWQKKAGIIIIQSESSRVH
jgi:hypothetical protein